MRQALMLCVARAARLSVERRCVRLAWTRWRDVRCRERARKVDFWRVSGCERDQAGGGMRSEAGGLNLVVSDVLLASRVVAETASSVVWVDSTALLVSNNGSSSTSRS